MFRPVHWPDVRTLVYSLDMDTRGYSLGLYEKAIPITLSLREKLDAAARNGFDFMELSVDETDEKLARLDSSAAWRRDLCASMFDAGLPIRTMCLSGHRKYPLGSPDEATRARGMDIMGKAIILAADLGIRIVQLAGYDVYYEPGNERTRALFSENLARAVEFAARYGVILAFETMETPFMNTVAKALEFVDAIDSPYLRVYPDIGNVTNACGGDAVLAAADLRGGTGKLAAVHLKETREGVYRDMRFGEGRVDFDACIDAAFDAGARMFVTEFWFLGAQDWEADLGHARDFMRPKLDARAEKAARAVKIS